VIATHPAPAEFFYNAVMRDGLASSTPTRHSDSLARKIAAITLLVWKKGVRFDAEHLKQLAA
jgi:hypothetical protein